ncbi:MAG: TIGR01212 family radical SAM protein [Lachnospiraceae bacterium]|nr:TIGR01212 family radical SAM protein [Lachnospiraceae bacterium]MDE7271444.1 TIGR01212 family radical SAM protein [Lachnospiraceae bacterium]
MRWNDKPYHTLDYALKSKYGEKIYKIALDAGMTCPNRDGSCGVRGCIFCSAGGSGDFAVKKTDREISIAAQLEQGKQSFHGKNIGHRFIAYFQSYTNTYAPAAKLEALYREALDEPSVVGISIATRPDCLGCDVLRLLDSLNKEYTDKFIWIELGLQTIHENTATLIRRGYALPVFEQAVAHLRKIGIPIIAHIIIGLPGEDRSMMLETCHFLASKGISGIKLQLLHVLKNTDLVELYNKKTFEILDMMEYIDIIISCLEVLPPDMVIHRVTGDGPKTLLLAPLWSLDKRRVLNTLHQEMRRRNTWQSKACQITHAII